MPFRIDSLSHPKPSIKDTISPQERPQIDFKKTLTQIQVNKNRELEEFISRLDVLGEKLAQSLSLKDLHEFREATKSFLRSTFGQGSKMQEEAFWDLHGQPKVLARVNKINRALDDLGYQFLNRHPKPLEVLAKIDEIRGLILDLFA